MAALFGGAASSMSAPATSAAAAAVEPARSGAAAQSSAQPASDLNSLIAQAARDLADYQRLTAEGKLGEAGQKLEELKRALDKLNARR
jgi:Skp family chaperone for outer membrane proteins